MKTPSEPVDLTRRRHPGFFRGSGQVVLVVDDDAMIRAVIQAFLQTVDLNVVTAVDGHAALVEFDRRRSEIDLVISDLQMPKMDGVSLVRALKRIPP